HTGRHGKAPDQARPLCGVQSRIRPWHQVRLPDRRQSRRLPHEHAANGALALTRRTRMFLANAYPWFKGIHIIAVISWMAGLLYLPRLFVNHATVAAGSEASEMLKRMEGKLLKVI